MADSETGKSPRPRNQSALRTVDILTAVAQSPSGLTVQEIAHHLGLPIQTAYRLLRPLNRAQLTRRDGDGRHVLGVGAQDLIRGYTRRSEQVDFTPHLQALAASTRESAHMAGWSDGEISILAAVRAWPLNDLVDVQAGPYFAAYSRAAGKLLLALAESSVRDAYLDKIPLESMTARTITDRGSLEEEFQLIRAQGYAVELEEFARGVCALAAPVQIAGSDYAMGLSVPADRFHANFPGLLDELRTHAATAAEHVITY